jgi:spermidine/putrescine transport system substrate-binding protein
MMTQNKALHLFIAILVFMTAGILCGCKEKQKPQLKTVTVMTYSEYIGQEMITDFQMKTGYQLKLELYEAQEEMIAKLQATGTDNYDVIIASDVVIQQMIKLGFIVPIDTNKIPNRENVADQFKSPAYDPTNTYTLPYLWGTTGILYRDSSIAPNNVSYNMLFDSTQTKGNFSLLDESRSMLSMALQASGFNANSVRYREITKASKLLLQAKKDPNFVGFDGSEIAKNKVLSGIYWAAIVFNGEAMDAINEDSTLQYAIPVEGSFMWVDAMTLSSKSKNVPGALAFMNYILDAETGAKLAKSVYFASPNKASLKLLDDDFKNNRVINPTKEEIDRMVFLRDPGDAAVTFDEAWENVKAK